MRICSDGKEWDIGIIVSFNHEDRNFYPENEGKVPKTAVRLLMSRRENKAL